MKKIIFSIMLTLFSLFPINVLAEGYVSVSPTSLTIEKGSSKTFIISAYNTIGDVSIVSNNKNIATTNLSEWETEMVDEKTTKTGKITVTGVNIGKTTITLNIDAATFDEEDLSGQTKTITVNVVEKTTEPSEPSEPNDETYELKLNFDKNVRLYINNSSISISPYVIDLKENENYKLSDYIAKKDGYNFTGWDTSSNCNSPSKTGTYKITNDTSLYACFEINKISSENNINQNVTENPKTGNYGIVIALIITGLAAIICSIIYFKKIEKNN